MNEQPGIKRWDDVTIVIATKGRKEIISKTVASIPHRPLILVVDKGRKEMDLPDKLDSVEVVECEPDCGSVKASESGICSAKTRLVCYMPDDVEFPRPDWLENAHAAYMAQIGEGKDGVIAMNDLIENGGIACIGLTSQDFYFKHIYPSPYKRYYVDTEMTQKAMNLHRYGYAQNSVVKHLVVDGRDKAQMELDAIIFNQRMQKFMCDLVETKGRKKLFVGVPIYGGVDPHFFKCFTTMVAEFNVSMVIFPYVGDSLVCRARNAITRHFLKSDCTHLLMLDSDLIFGAHQIKRILEHDADVVGGVYCKKQEGNPCVVANKLDTPVTEDANGLVEVKYVGTGFMRISRRVFEEMIKAYGEDMWYKLDHEQQSIEYDFWRAAPYEYKDGTRRYLSEDWWFCQKWIDLGGKVYMDLRCVLKHSGGAIYPLSYQEKLLFHQPETAIGNCAADTVIPSPVAVEAAQPILA